MAMQSPGQKPKRFQFEVTESDLWFFLSLYCAMYFVFLFDTFSWWGFGFWVGGLIGVLMAIEFLRSSHVAKKREMRLQHPTEYLKKFAQKNKRPQWSDRVDLEEACPRCGRHLTGNDLDKEILESEEPPAAWMICKSLSCDYETLRFASFPWTLSQGDDLRREARLKEELARIHAFEERQRKKEISTLRGLKRISPSDFEEAVAEILLANGYQEASVRGGPGDLAVDIECKDAQGASVAVQCKKYKEKAVGSKEMQTFIGMIHTHHRSARGTYVTTSRFTKPAEELADAHQIDLVDGNRLVRMAKLLRPKDGDEEELEELKKLEAWKVREERMRSLFKETWRTG